VLKDYLRELLNHYLRKVSLICFVDGFSVCSDAIQKAFSKCHVRYPIARLRLTGVITPNCPLRNKSTTQNKATTPPIAQ
ncbi:hypothetical protein CEXT_182681, partial [Caerostris extrusa]